MEEKIRSLIKSKERMIAGKNSHIGRLMAEQKFEIVAGLSLTRLINRIAFRPLISFPTRFDYSPIIIVGIRGSSNKSS